MLKTLTRNIPAGTLSEIKYINFGFQEYLISYEYSLFCNFDSKNDVTASWGLKSNDPYTPNFKVGFERGILINEIKLEFRWKFYSWNKLKTPWPPLIYNFSLLSILTKNKIAARV